MVALGFYHGRGVTSAALAQSINADPTFVRKMVAKLGKAGLLKATRGKGGACVLARPAAAITLLDIYHAAQAPAAFSIHAYPAEPACRVSANVKPLLANVQSGAQRAVERELAQHCLADLINEISPSP
jgi:DNA-binding IscR family transcriptional regulator